MPMRIKLFDQKKREDWLITNVQSYHTHTHEGKLFIWSDSFLPECGRNLTMSWHLILLFSWCLEARKEERERKGKLLLFAPISSFPHICLHFLHVSHGKVTKFPLVIGPWSRLIANRGCHPLIPVLDPSWVRYNKWQPWSNRFSFFLCRFHTFQHVYLHWPEHP